LIFPFLLKFFERYGSRYLLGLIALSVIIRGMMHLISGSIQDGLLDDPRSHRSVLVGMLVAVTYERRQKLLASPFAFGFSIAAIIAWFYAFTWWTGGGYYGKDAPTSSAWILSPTIEGAVCALAILA
jgi:hypothetical protein